MIVSGRSPSTPAAEPPEFRRRAVERARRGEQPVEQIAKDLGIGESCLRRWTPSTLSIPVARRPQQRRAARAGRAAPSDPGAGDGERDPHPGQRLLRAGASSQNRVPAGPGARRCRDRGRGDRPGSERLTLGPLRMARPRTSPRDPQDAYVLRSISSLYLPFTVATVGLLDGSAPWPPRSLTLRYAWHASRSSAAPASTRCANYSATELIAPDGRAAGHRTQRLGRSRPPSDELSGPE